MAEDLQDQDPDDLQFSAVESATPGQVPGAPQCVVCERPIADTYFTAGDKVVCPGCRDQYEATLATGSKLWRFVKATALGMIAGIMGAAVWFGIRWATDRIFALVAIGVGLLVGGAVRLGSEGRGGRGYQFLAVVLTYLAVGLAFAPDIVIEGVKKYKESHHSNTAVAHAGATTLPTSRSTAATQEAKTTTALDDDDSDDPSQPQKPFTGKQFAIAIVVLLLAATGLVLAGPVLVAFSSIFGAIIVGFALWEAWKINRSRRLSLAGPYSLAGTPTPISQPLPPAAPGSFQ